MSEIKRIMIPTDFSRSAENAMRYAAGLVENDKEKEVTFIYVTEKPEEVSDKLSDFKEQFQELSSTPCSTKSDAGKLNDVLLKYQKEEKYDLIIMGTKGSNDENETTNTSTFVLDVDAPVLVVPNEVNSFKVHNIALALGAGSIDDSTALNPLHSIARSHGAKIHVLTVNNNGEKSIDGDYSTEGVLEYYLETLDFHHVFPKNSDIEKGIADYVEGHNIDMLAIIPRNHAKKNCTVRR